MRLLLALVPGSPALGLQAPNWSAAGVAGQLETVPHQPNKLTQALEKGSDVSVENMGTEFPVNELYAWCA